VHKTYYKEQQPMFIVSVSYQQPLEVVDKHLPDHLAFLDRYFAAGTFIASGRKVPRTGGIILATGVTREQLDLILLEDPFNQHKVARYEVTEFEPNRTGPEYGWFLKL
jgi:uncharacterized protein YciI